MSEFWSDPSFTSGEYVSWEEGTVVIGEVTALATHTFEANERGPGRTVPMVLVRDQNGHDQEITCGPADLKKKMVAAAPNVGDRIRIECIGSTKVSVGIQRFFSVKVQKASPFNVTPEHAQAVADGNKIADASNRHPGPFGDDNGPNGADQIPF